jgi:hypothetical protein
MAPLTSSGGMSSSTAWTSTGRGMRPGQERALYTNRQHSGVSLIETRAGLTTTDARARPLPNEAADAAPLCALPRAGDARF